MSIEKLLERQRALAKEAEDIASEIKKLKAVKDWDAKPDHDNFLFLSGGGIIDLNAPNPADYWLRGNASNNRADLEAKDRKDLARARIIRHAKSLGEDLRFVPDRINYYIFYNHKTKNLEIMDREWCVNYEICFREQENAFASIKECEADWKVLLGVSDE